MVNYYSELNLDKSKSAKELSDQLITERKKWMQRQNASSPEKQQEAIRKVALIDEAREVFKDDASKKAYDEKLKASQAPAPKPPAPTPTPAPKPSSTTSSSSGGTSRTGSTSSSGSASSTSSSTGSTSGTSSGGSSSSTAPKKKKGKVWIIIIAVVVIGLLIIYRNPLMSLITGGTYQAKVVQSIPGKAEEFNGNRYYLFETKMTWTEAKALCEKKGGHLVTITTEEEGDFVRGYMVRHGYSDAHIGLFNAQTEENRKWCWVTGETGDYFNWAGEERHNQRRYVKYSANGWEDIDNKKELPYLCEWENKSSEIGINDEDPTLGGGVFECNGHYYRIFDDKNTWVDAKAACEQKHGYLAVITSKEEDMCILKHVNLGNYTHTAFGYYNTGTAEAQKWKWVNGEESKYTNWAEGQPDYYRGEEMYGEYYTDGKWNDCANDIVEAYICEWDNREDVLTIANTPTGSSSYTVWTVVLHIIGFAIFAAASILCFCEGQDMPKILMFVMPALIFILKLIFGEERMNMLLGSDNEFTSLMIPYAVQGVISFLTSWGLVGWITGIISAIMALLCLFGSLFNFHF